MIRVVLKTKKMKSETRDRLATVRRFVVGQLTMASGSVESGLKIFVVFLKL